MTQRPPVQRRSLWWGRVLIWVCAAIFWGGLLGGFALILYTLVQAES